MSGRTVSDILFVREAQSFSGEFDPGEAGYDYCSPVDVRIRNRARPLEYNWIV